MKKYNPLQTHSGKSQKTIKFIKIAAVLIAAIYVITAVTLDVHAAITGKIAGVITAEATNEPAGECYANNRRNKQHRDNKRRWLLRDDQHLTRRL